MDERSRGDSEAPTEITSSRPSLPLPDRAAIESLLADPLLRSCRRTGLEGVELPSIGGIVLLSKIGQGGMGAVYRGFKPLLRREVAVKLLPLHAAQLQPQLIERFVREAQIAASVDSPHLVRVTDVGDEEGLFFIVMEYVRGTSAGAYSKRLAAEGRRMEEAGALDVAIAATRGLAAAHLRGIIHRDVKPDNILIPADDAGRLRLDEAKLADLGLARNEEMAQTLTETQLGMGTPGYMAPEQAMSARKAGKPADVFGIGATLYTLLAGRPPFTGETSTAVVMATIQEPHPPIRTLRADISEVTATLLDHTLAKQPADRFPDADALLEALVLCRTALDEQSTLHVVDAIDRMRAAREVGERVQSVWQRPAEGERPLPGGSSRRFVGLAVAALVVIVAAAALLLTWRPDFGRFAAASAVAEPALTATAIDVAYSGELEPWVRWAVEEFGKSEAGAGIRIAARPVSGDAARRTIVDRGDEVDVWIAATAIEREEIDALHRSRHGEGAFAEATTVALTPHVVVMFSDRYDALSRRNGSVDFARIREALAAGRWEAIGGRPEWGRFTFAMTNPAERLSGITAMTLAAAEYFRTDRALTAAQLSDPAFLEWARGFAPAIAISGNSSDAIRSMVLRGPSSFDGAIVNESDAIQQLTHLEDRWQKVKVLYPAINMWNEATFYVTSRAGSDERAAASALSTFLLGDRAQRQLVLLGFRPANPATPLHFEGSPFNRLRELDLSLEVPVAADPPTRDAVEILTSTSWR